MENGGYAVKETVNTMKGVALIEVPVRSSNKY